MHHELATLQIKREVLFSQSNWSDEQGIRVLESKLTSVARSFVLDEIEEIKELSTDEWGSTFETLKYS